MGRVKDALCPDIAPDALRTNDIYLSIESIVCHHLLQAGEPVSPKLAGLITEEIIETLVTKLCR